MKRRIVEVIVFLLSDDSEIISGAAVSVYARL